MHCFSYSSPTRSRRTLKCYCTGQYTRAFLCGFPIGFEGFLFTRAIFLFTFDYIYSRLVRIKSGGYMRPSVYTFPGSFISPTRMVVQKRFFFIFNRTHASRIVILSRCRHKAHLWLSRTQSFRGFARNHFRISRYVHVIVSLSVSDEQKSRWRRGRFDGD